MSSKEIYYATGNPGKFAEVKKYVDSHVKLFTLKQFDIDTVEIQTLDQKEVAIYKARQAYAALKKPLLIDDGGIFFEGYNQFPGTLSKYVFQAIGFDGLFKLIKSGDKASFILQMAYIDEYTLEIFEGRCDGTVVYPNIEANPHLPFTAMFKPYGCDKTFAELHDTSDFEKYSYRYQALKKFIKWYEKRK